MEHTHFRAPPYRRLAKYARARHSGHRRPRDSGIPLTSPPPLRRSGRPVARRVLQVPGRRYRPASTLVRDEQAASAPGPRVLRLLPRARDRRHCGGGTGGGQGARRRSRRPRTALISQEGAVCGPCGSLAACSTTRLAWQKRCFAAALEPSPSVRSTLAPCSFCNSLLLSTRGCAHPPTQAPQWPRCSQVGGSCCLRYVGASFAMLEVVRGGDMVGPRSLIVRNALVLAALACQPVLRGRDR